VVLTAAILLTLVTGSGTALARKHTYRLKKGVTLTTVYRAQGPIRYRYITVSSPSKHSATLDVGSASNSFPGTRRPSDMGHAYGAIAAVNGDFGKDGRPLHVSAEDGNLRSSGLRTGVALAVSHNERRGWANRPRPRVLADAGRRQVGRFAVDVWNAGSTGSGRFAAFTRVGGNVERPDSDNCSARVLPAAGDAGKRRWGPHGEVVRIYVVERQPDPCPNDPLSVGDEGGAVVLQGSRGTARGETIKALQPGDKVKLSWTVGWPNVLDVIGGAPQLLADPDGDGRPAIKAPKSCDSYFCSRNPRSAAGVNRACVTGSDGCKIIMMTVDGRQSGWSSGMDLVQLARAMRDAGADWAINLDGGGGAAMWVANRGRYCQARKPEGCLVSRPSDPSGERPAISSLMVLPDRDRGEPLRSVEGMASSLVVPEYGTQQDLTASEAALTDPGSTGGLLDAIFGGELGQVPSRSSALWDDVQIYRASQR
jgi:hypothetical protein